MEQRTTEREEAQQATDTVAQAAAEGLRIDYRPVDALIPYARNARSHSAAQIALIAGSIREYGFTNPVLADGSNVSSALKQSVRFTAVCRPRWT